MSNKKNRFQIVSQICVVVFLLSFAPSVPAHPVPDTGQGRCYDDSKEIPCSQPDENFYGQDANYINPPQSYTKIDTQGNDLDDSADEWAMVRDNISGLIWEVKVGNGHDRNQTYDRSGAYGFIDSLNSTNFGGFSDWRLPDLKEVTSIVNRDNYGPSVNQIFFPNTRSGLYRSQNVNWSLSENVWCVDFTDGMVIYKNKYDSFYVRAVRGEKLFPYYAADFQFNDSGGGTVTDDNTELMWQQDTAAQMNWKDALAYCEKLSLSNYDDWRLPDINELESLAVYTLTSGVWDRDAFPNSFVNEYWSSTSSSEYCSTAWMVHFFFGNIQRRGKSENFHVRCVRSGLGNFKILIPEKDSRWNIGSKMPITWDHQNIGGDVEISISRTDGEFDTIQTTENDGLWEWEIAGEVSADCMIKIVPLNDPSRADTQGPFTITNVLLYNIYIDDADRNVVVNKAKGDLIEIVHEITNEGIEDEEITLTVNVPDEWIFVRWYSRDDSKGTNQIDHTDLYDAAKHEIQATVSKKAVQIGIRFIIPENPLDKRISISSQISLRNGIPLENDLSTNVSVIDSVRAIIVTNRDNLYEIYSDEAIKLIKKLFEIADGKEDGELSSVVYYADWYDGDIKTYNGTKPTIDNDISEKFDDLVEKFSENLIPRPQYLLIVGGHDILPFYKINSSIENYFTDTIYADIENDDFMKGELEISCGRIVGADINDMILLIKNGINGPQGKNKAVIASQEHYDVDGAYDTFSKFGFYVSYENELVETKKWTKELFIDAMNQGNNKYIIEAGHGGKIWMKAGNNDDFYIKDINQGIIADKDDSFFVGVGICNGGKIELHSRDYTSSWALFFIHLGACGYFGSTGVVYSISLDGLEWYGEQMGTIKPKPTLCCFIIDRSRTNTILKFFRNILPHFFIQISLFLLCNT
ncbi:MAG: DUF1566 domain-containing protein, partial [Desulfobacterales bacterium]|nr:DUF1566 domain-containing protein [Desulfobacterales bacterium]